MPARGTRPAGGAGSPYPRERPGDGGENPPASAWGELSLRLGSPSPRSLARGRGGVTSGVPSGPRGRSGAVSGVPSGSLLVPGPRWGRLRGLWRCSEPPLPTLLLPAPAEDGCAGSRGQVVSVSGDELSRGALGPAMEPQSRCVPVLSARSVPVGWYLFPISRLVVGFAGQQEGACSQDPGCGRWAWWDSQPAPALVLHRCSVPGMALEVLLLLFFLFISPLSTFLAGTAPARGRGCPAELERWLRAGDEVQPLGCGQREARGCGQMMLRVSDRCRPAWGRALLGGF